MKIESIQIRHLEFAPDEFAGETMDQKLSHWQDRYGTPYAIKFFGKYYQLKRLKKRLRDYETELKITTKIDPYGTVDRRGMIMEVSYD